MPNHSVSFQSSMISKMLSHTLQLIAVVSAVLFIDGTKLKAGEVLISDFSQSTVIRVDTVSGDRTIVSGGRPTPVGAGPMFGSLTGIALEPDGSILALERFDNIYRVDPATGDRVELSSPNVGAGVPLFNPSALDRAADGTIFIADLGDGSANSVAVKQVDPTTGDRLVTSGIGQGTGPLFFGANSIAVDNDQDLLVAASGAVFGIELDTGDRTVISGESVGNGPGLSRIRGIEVSPTGRLIASGGLVFDSVVMSVLFEIDRETGDRTVLSGAGVGSGPAVDRLAQFAFLSDNSVIIGHERELFEIDLLTGDRTLISAGSNSSLGTVGGGPVFFDVVDVTVVPNAIPEPSMYGVFLLASLVWGTRREKRGNQSRRSC